MSIHLANKYSQPIRILLVDDQLLLLDALSALLKNSIFQIDIVGCATNGIQAIEHALQLKPDLILMDLLMPEMNGNDATYQISRRVPECKILMLSSNNKKEEISVARKSGANGYILKSIDQDGLNQAIAAVMSNKYDFINSDFNQNTNSKEHITPKTNKLLTRREQQVIKMLVEGRKNKDISELLNISIRTVEKHRANLMKKLDTPSPIELAILAKKMGLVVS